MRSSLAALVLFGLVGCHSLTPEARSKLDEEMARDKDLEVRTVGDVTELSSANPWQISGVGLVVGLDGTGHSPPGSWREKLESSLRTRNIPNIKSLLDNPNHALVLVNGFILPGYRKSELFDVTVSLPQGSKATSLKGGFLQECSLENFEMANKINPEKSGLIKGHVLARAQGPLVVGLGSDEDIDLRRGKIWQGGVSLVDRPFFFAMTKDEKSARVANAVAERINLMFQDDPKKQQLVRENMRLLLLDDVTHQLNEKFELTGMRSRLAAPVTPDVISVSVPYAYRYNPERYLRVARLLPLREDPAQLAKYRQRLSKMLLDPADALRAALRLEALGKDSVPILRTGLASPNPFVRFAAGESLTYLGSTAGIEQLSKLAVQYPPLRSYVLVAMAGLDEGLCRNKLNEMVATDDPQLRIGAFTALRLMLTDDLDVLASVKNRKRVQTLHEEKLRDLGGENLDIFWLHQVAPNSAPLVQYSITRRAEVVIFGHDVRLVAPVHLIVNREFSIVAEEGSQALTITRVSDEGKVQQKCSLELAEALRTLRSLGAEYADIVEFLRLVESDRVLNCPISVNQPPVMLTIEELYELGKDPKMFR